MFHGKMKAVTFSYDDGVTQDRQLIRLLNKYGLKATFNLNSERFGRASSLVRMDTTVAFVVPREEEIRAIYAGHEVAAHTLTHPNLVEVADDAEVVRQVALDRENLSRVMGYDVVGMAYPGGGVNCDDRVAALVRGQGGVQYARTTRSTYNFDLQDDLIQFKPTACSDDMSDRLFALADEFIALRPETPKLFYIWGHSFMFDCADHWEKMERFCEKIAGHDDIFYGTNKEVLLP